MSPLPEALERRLGLFDLLTDRAERLELLLDVANRFREVPERIARRPFAPERRTPACESEVYVFAEPLDDGRLKFHFAVENPQGIAARALAVLLDETLSGAAPESVAEVQPDIVTRIFGADLSMGKSVGLQGMVAMVRAAARRHLAARGGRDGRLIPPATA
jgi:cysteine desulfuration protein SufE